MMKSTLLELENVIAQTNNNIRLTGLNVRLLAGSIHAIISLSGLELQAFIDVLYKNTKSFAGKYLINGKSVPQKSIYKNIDLLDALTGIYPDLSVFDNIYVKMEDEGSLIRKSQKEKIKGIFEEYSIHISLDEKMRTLSREKQNLVQLIGALVSRRSILIINDLDFKLGKSYSSLKRRILEKILKDGRGILLLTSVLETAMTNSDEMSILTNSMIKMTFDTKKIIDNPRKVIYMLSGWTPIENQIPGKDAEVLESIVQARYLLNSTSELKNELRFLAQDITQVFNAVKTEICLVDVENGIWLNVYGDGVLEKTSRELINILNQLIRNNKFVSINSSSRTYHCLFSSPEIQTVVCKPIDSKERAIGVVLVYFNQNREFIDKDQNYLESFCKEISIAIETSHLMGRSLLLQESHHRMKNNLQVVNSLVFLQKMAVRRNEISVDEAFDSISRMVSGIAAVHDILAKDTTNTSIINLSKIVNVLIGFYEMSDVKIEASVDNISVPYNVGVSISLVVNELINNCMKHAFKNQKDKRIWIKGWNNGETIQLSILNNGTGFSEKHERCSSTGNLGLNLNNYLIQSLNGKIIYGNSAGACVTLFIPVTHVYSGLNMS